MTSVLIDVIIHFIFFIIRGFIFVPSKHCKRHIHVLRRRPFTADSVLNLADRTFERVHLLP